MIGRSLSSDDQIALLEEGADHVMNELVSTEELDSSDTSPGIRAGPLLTHVGVDGITLRADERDVVRRGRQVVLTVTEFRLMTMLFRNAGRVVARRQLLLLVWGIA